MIQHKYICIQVINPYYGHKEKNVIVMLTLLLTILFYINYIT